MSKWSRYRVYKDRLFNISSKYQFKRIARLNYQHLFEFRLIRHLLPLVIVAFLVTSCRTIQPISTERDSVRIETITKHDTILSIKADSAALDALLHCDSNYNVILDELATANGERIRLFAELKNMRTKSSNNKPQFAFNVDCKEDSLQHRIEWLEREIKTAKSERIVVTEKVTPKWAWYCLIACIALVAGIVVRTVIKIYAKR